MNKETLKKYLIGQFTFKRLIKSTLFVLITSALISCAISDQIIFKPPRPSYSNSSDIIRISTENGEDICAYHLINPNAEFTILYSHGNAEDIGQNLDYFERMFSRGYSVLAYDYRGYGCSQGKPSEKNARKDIEAAYSYLVNDALVPPEKIIAMGRSLGGGLAVHIAGKKEVAGVILQSAFVSAFRVITRVKLLPYDKFDNISKIKSIDCPILIMHGKKDMIIAPWHGKTLYDAANTPKKYLWVEDAGHNDDMSILAGEKYWKTIKDFTEMIK